MPLLKSNGLAMPPDFPSAAYDQISDYVTAKRATHPNYPDFVGAWHAVSYRYLASTEYGSSFVTSFSTFGAGPAPPQRCEQEKMLFGLFGSGMSSVEAAFFALYTLGAMVPGQSFSLQSDDDRRQVNPRSTEDAFKASFSADPVVGILAAVRTDKALKDFAAARHSLTHREAPRRKHFMGDGNDRTEWGFRNWPLDASLATDSRHLIASVLDRLLQGANVFVKAHLV